MSSAISSLSSSTWASDLFSKIDTKKQGYIDKSSFQSALNQTSSDMSASDVETAFNSLDGNSDGKITKQEMSDAVQTLATALDNQYNQSRVSSTSGDDTGFTKDELTSMISDIGDSDTKRSTLMQSIVNNFAKADADSDGKVSNSEAMAYDEATSTSGTSSISGSSAVASAGGAPPPPPPSSSASSSDSTSSDSSTTYATADTNKDGTVSFDELIAYEAQNTTSSSTDSASALKIIAQLMQSYGLTNSSASSSSSSISAIA